VFALDDPNAVRHGIDGCGTVLLVAGPFSATSRPMLDACLEKGAHYLDLTGEVGVFEACHARDAEARARNVVVLPGAGFDVVPSDCLAATVKEQLPDATSLELAFSWGGTSVSRGTFETMMEAARDGSYARRHGRIEHEPLFAHQRDVPFRHQRLRGVSIPWGDVSTAYYSTGIPDIVVYVAVPRVVAAMAPVVRAVAPRFARLVAKPSVQRWLDSKRMGPSERARSVQTCHLWARASNARGQSVEATLVVPETYRFTQVVTVECVRRVLENKLPPGATTPSRAFGARFVTEFDGCDLKGA